MTTRRPDTAALTPQILEQLAGLLPEAQSAQLAGLLAGLQLRSDHARQLRDHLTAHADALVSGRSDAPAAHLRLLDALAAGHPEVQRARCTTCQQPKRLPYKSEAGRACVNCYAEAKTERCVRCGEAGRVAFREDGGVVCQRCQRRDPAAWEQCFLCAKRRRVYYRVAGQPLCQSCGPRPSRRCGSCGQDKPVHASTPDGPVCGRCYHLARAAECQRCGRRVPSRRRNPDGALVCERCWTPPLTECAGCGEIKQCSRGAWAAQRLCGSCRGKTQPRRTCVRCRKQQRVHSRLPMGNICSPCYTKIRRWPGQCATCSQQRPLIGLDEKQRRICGPCCGDDRNWICRTCGRFAALFSDGRCPHCVARERIQRLLADPDGQPRPQLGPLRQLLEAEIDADPFTIIIWLPRVGWAELLGQLAAQHDQITHATLDALPRRRHVDYLRTVLVNTGILPARAEHVEGTAAWLEELLAGLPPTAALIIRPYATWSVIRRARNRARRRPATRSVRKYIRSRILIAARFLTWLDEQGLTLGTVTQAELDVWLEGGSSNHYRLRDFAVWAGARGITGSQLEVPWLGRADQPSEVLDDAQRWQLLKRCLHDDQIELPLRVAGALVLLYGQVPIRIVALTADHITMKGTSTYLTLDTQPVLVPPRLAGLLARLAGGEPAGRRPLVERHGDGSRLLFPGSHPGQPMDFDRLSAALNQKLGLRVRPARNAALCALAADLPAPVLAELLGLHISTAIRWGRLVRRDWTSYLAARKGQASHAP